MVLFVSTLLPLPMDTPIPCLICTGMVAQTTATFTGTVAASGNARLTVYDFTSRRSMTFVVPPGVHDAPTVPGTYTRITYNRSGGTNVVTAVRILTRATIPGRNALL